MVLRYANIQLNILLINPSMALHYSTTMFVVATGGYYLQTNIHIFSIPAYRLSRGVGNIYTLKGYADPAVGADNKQQGLKV